MLVNLYDAVCKRRLWNLKSRNKNIASDFAQQA